MAFEMPLDQIKQLQILLREKASLSWYQPEKEGNLALPKLPSVAETVSKLDPSPPNLRCKNCNGRLLRGLQSFMCVFCGTNPHEDLPPDLIKFKNSIGYRWLLESLHLDGSEMVAPTLDENALNRGRSESKDEIPLSELLDLEIRWPSEAERTLSNNSDSTASPGKSSLNLAGVDLDSFFDRRDSDSDISEQKLTSRIEVGAASDNTLKANKNLSQAWEAATGSTEDQSGDSFSGWEADFKSASSGPVHEGSQSDHSKVESHSVSGNWDGSVGVKKNNDINPSASTKNDGYQGDEWRTSNSELHNQSGKSESGMNLNQTKLPETANGSSTRNFDWMQDDQWEGNDNKTPDTVGNNEADDSFDTWNDFTGSVSTRDPSSIVSAELNDTKATESATSSFNRDLDWVQDNNNNAIDNISTNEAADSFDAWNDFTGSANAQYSSTSVSISEITGQTGILGFTKDPNDTKTAESATGSSSNFDWMRDETWKGSNNKGIGIVTSNESIDSFDAWNDFTGSAISQNPSSSVSNYQITGQAVKSEISPDLNDTKTGNGADASSAKSFDWMEDGQWQFSVNKATDTVTTNDIADSFDVWNGFTSWTSTQDPSDNIYEQTESQTSAEKRSETDLFSSSNNLHDMDFSGFSQHDLLFGQFDNPLTSLPATNVQPAAASSNRVADLDSTRVNSGDVSSAEVGSKDVEMLMSQMHDLSFMLESNFSALPK
ncbi:uncharacterized protein LOC130711968 [Lotus japonicus]|uniref:uncharacterized protein LOC130711968 n=1 Tax=Lotus japonicus TaxID=34305 RepID=UPI0025837EA1|nr:uncharacterized protein LOC130711968 [Lotus japonicus]